MSISELIKHLNEDFFFDNNEESIEMHIREGNIERKDIENRWLGYLPATKENIEKREKQLITKLPPSYREFLLATNGFRNVSPFLNNLLPVEKIDWAKNVEEQWSLELFEDDDEDEVSDEDYFNYTNTQDSVLSRGRYVLESLKVSDWYESMCIFLNPLIKFGEEWEVLEYASWFPGIRRYRSFKDYLTAIHESNQRLLIGSVKK